MADYLNLQVAIDAGTTNMTVVRNNSANDDGVDTIATGITWFYFNSVQVTNLYVSGNSFMGFGANSEQLKVNRRDAKAYYLYSESGKIGLSSFYKIRWKGYSAYNQTADKYLQEYDVFVFDTGDIYLNFLDVPTGSVDGTNALVCGGSTVSFSIVAGTPCEFTFTPSDAATGTGWSVVSGRPNIVTLYKPSGNAVYELSGFIGKIKESSMSWNETKPDGTTLVVSFSLDGVTYSPVTSGGSLLTNGTLLTDKTIHIKIEMTTTDNTVTPSLSGLAVYLRTSQDAYSVVLETEDMQRFCNTASTVTVDYDGGGNLLGEGGPVAAFSETFTPDGLAYKGNQNDAEHMEIPSIDVTAVLTRIYYTNTAGQDQGHLEIAEITAVGTLARIEDI